MNDQENIRRIRMKEIRDKEWEIIHKEMKAGSKLPMQAPFVLEGEKDFVAEVAEENPDMVRLEPHEKFDPAIIGVVERINFHVLCYNVAEILLILQDDMSEDEAREYFDFNILGSWMGDHTPVFLSTINPYKIFNV